MKERKLFNMVAYEIKSTMLKYDIQPKSMINILYHIIEQMEAEENGKGSS